MKMKSFRVQNYKKIGDTGWIKCNNLTAFVGKNESGKSAIFRGLSKLNPSDGEKYDILKEFPRKRYASEHKTKNWPVSSVEFELNSSEKEELEVTCSALKDVSTVICTRYYSNAYSVEFKPQPPITPILISAYIKSLKSWKVKVEQTTAPEGKGDRLGQIKTVLTNTFTTNITNLESQYQLGKIPSNIVTEISNVVMTNLNEQWEKEQFKQIIDENSVYSNIIRMENEIAVANKWVYDNIPQFIYFDRYDILDSAIHLDDFIRKLQNKSTDPKLRITKCLFEHVGLDIEKIRALDPNDDKKTEEELRRMADERHINMSSASAAMTEKFADWWEQRKHKFRYQIDGKLFRVWVSDDLDPSEIELDQRSSGMQYFFSFYLIFLVESNRAHTNSILLLDEPGLQYHGTAQRKAVEFLEKISAKNQLLYSTHSPFMIDGDKLDDVRIVYEDQKTGSTLVSDDVWPKDEDSLFPLQAGLGYSIAQTLFYSKYQLVVEGLTDYSILMAMSELLNRKKMITLHSDIIITPAGGTRNIMPLASMLIGHKIKIAVLLDADQPGTQKKKQVEKLQINCIMVSSITGKEETELEDLFDESLYLDAFKIAYPDKPVSFSDGEMKITSVTTRIEKVFERLGYGKFEKWKLANILVDWIQQDSPSHKISDKTCKDFESIFVIANNLLKKT